MDNNQSNISIQNYLDEIAKYTPLPVEEEIELAKRIREGDGNALNKLVKANLRFVISIAKKYQGRGLPLQDLISEGNYGLIKAALKFDETKGFKFISYAVWWIRQAILQALSDHTRNVRLPLNRIGAMRKIGKTMASLEQIHGRKPTTEEVAEEMGLDKANIEDVLNDFNPNLKLENTASNDDDRELLDTLESEEFASPDKALLEESLLIDLNRVLGTLRPREAEVIRYYYGLEGGKPLSLGEIGEMYNLTRERVRQIKEKALARLRLQLRNEPLKVYLG